MTIRPRVPADLPGCVEALRLVQDADAYPLNWPGDSQHTAVAEWSTPDGRPVELRYYVDRETEQRYWVDGPDPR